MTPERTFPTHRIVVALAGASLLAAATVVGIAPAQAQPESTRPSQAPAKNQIVVSSDAVISAAEGDRISARASSASTITVSAVRNKKHKTVGTKLAVRSAATVTIAVTLTNNRTTTLRAKTGTRTVKPAATRLAAAAPGYVTLTAAVTGRKRTYTLHKTSGQGNPNSYKIADTSFDTGQPVRWDTCAYTATTTGDNWHTVTATAPRRTLTWSYGDGGAAANSWAARYVQHAFTDMHNASGWTFSQVPSGGDIVINADRAARTGHLNGYTNTSYGMRTYYAAIITVHIGNNTSTGLRNGLLTHELGHAIGLDHVSDRTQLMYPTLPSNTDGNLHTGDRNGAWLLGTRNGCAYQIGEQYYTNPEQ